VAGRIDLDEMGHIADHLGDGSPVEVSKGELLALVRIAKAAQVYRRVRFQEGAGKVGLELDEALEAVY
jgi:hypothetical protein